MADKVDVQIGPEARMYPRRSFMPFFLTLMLLLMCFSFALAQEEKREPKTFQLFAGDDDPSDIIEIKQRTKRKVFRKRRVVFSSALLNFKKGEIKKGDKIAGQLFEDKSVEATVKDVFEMGGRTAIISTLKYSNGVLKLWITKQTVTMIMQPDGKKSEYYTSYLKKKDRYTLKHEETEKAARDRREATLKVSRKQGPKTIQLFTDRDDPSNRMALDKTNPYLKHQVRMRKAFVNPLLFKYRIEEVNKGDTISGYLFEDEYFEGIVTSQPEKYYTDFRLELKIVGDDNNLNRISIVSKPDSIRLLIDDATRKKQFTISTNEDMDYHAVIENDPSKRPVMEH